MKVQVIDSYNKLSSNVNDEFDVVLVWNGTSFNNTSFIFIEDHLNIRKKHLRSHFLSLVNRFSEGEVNGNKLNAIFNLGNGKNLWDFSKFHELPHDRTKNLKKSLKFLTLVELLEISDVGYIHSLIDDVEVNKLLRYYCDNNGIDLIYDQPRWDVSKLYNFFIDILLIIKALVKIIHNTVIGLIFSIVNKKQWKEFSSKFILVTYFSNSENYNDLNRNFYESRFWPKIYSLFESRNLTYKWLHIYARNDSVMDAFRVVWFLSKNKLQSSSHVFVQSFFKWNTCFYVLLDYLKIVRSYFYAKNVLFKDFQVYAIFKLLKDEYRSSFIGTTAISNLFFCHNFELLKRATNRSQILFYPYENQSWEKIMLHYLNSDPKIRTLGYAHSSIRFWDLRYFVSLSTPYVPNYIAVNGNISKWNLEDFVDGPGKLPILEVEALKYLDQILNPISVSEAVSLIFETSSSPNFLFLGDYFIKTSEEVFGIFNSSVFQSLPSYSRSKFYFRGHPATKRLKVPNNFHDVSDIALKDSFYFCDIIITTSTSTSSLDAYIANKFVLIYCDDSNMNLTDFNADRNGLYFFRNRAELKEVLAKYSKFKETSYNNRSIDDLFYITRDKIFWNDALSLVLKE